MAFLKGKLNYEIIRENIGMIVLIPTFFGGLWQVMELASLGTPYLRFFSLSQLISDGLLILFILVFTVLPLWWYFRDADMPKFRFKTEIEVGEEQGSDIPIKKAIYSDGQMIWVSKKNGYYYLGTFTILYAIIMVFVFWPEIIVPLTQKTKISVFGLLGFFFMIMFSLIYFRILIKTIFEINTWKVNYDLKAVKEVISMLLLLSFFGLIIFFFYLTRLFHRSFLFPETFKNQSYVDCKIKAHNPGLMHYNIDYFNDKYIFVNITDKTGNKRIEIFKFEDFLDNSACSTNK